MATFSTWCRIGQGLGGILMGVGGGWLCVIFVLCLLTVSVISAVHAGILVSVLGIGVCGLVGGALLLYDAVCSPTCSPDPVSFEASEVRGEAAERLPQPTAPNFVAGVNPPLYPAANPLKTLPSNTPLPRPLSYNPFDT